MKCRIIGIVRAMRAVMRIARGDGAISEDSRPCESDQAMVRSSWR